MANLKTTRAVEIALEFQLFLIIYFFYLSLAVEN